MKPTNTHSSSRTAPSDSPTIKTHVWKHNVPLVESMFKTLILFLVTGLLINYGLHYVQKLLLITTGVGKEVEKYYNKVFSPTLEWRPFPESENIGEFYNRVTSFMEILHELAVQ